MPESPEDPAAAAHAGLATAPLGRLRAWLVDAPAYPANAADLRSVDVLGLRLPVRATVAIVTVTLILLLDYHGRIDALVAGMLGTPDTAAELKRVQSVGRLITLGIVPLLIVILAMRDRPARYGARLGDWRAGAAIAIAGCVVMTPIVLAVARVPAFTAYYAPQATATLGVVATTALEVIPAEFFFRGFLMFALLRVVGPVAVLIATLPFAFAHLGKPEVEVLSTVVGGLAYGWLDWRSGSVLWSGLAHTFVLSLVIVASGVVAGSPGG